MVRMSKTPRQHRARKRFGQNFLHDQIVIEQITEAIRPLSGQRVVEIGPGMGALTGLLVERDCSLDVIELDRDLVPGLLAAFSLKPGFQLHNADALNFDFHSLLRADNREQLRVVGNLPYNISTPLIFKLLKDCAIIKDMHFMLQREVVERLAATQGNKQWGRLGIMAQYLCNVEHLFDVPPEAFRPAPKVQSAIVRMTPRETSPWPDCDAAALGKLAKAAFAQRRKTLRNNLKGIIDSTDLERLGIDPGARAETLSMEQLISITNAINV